MHSIQAIIAATHVLDHVASTHAAARIVPLVQGLGIIPMTEELLYEIGGVSLEQVDAEGFLYLTTALSVFLKDISLKGPIAYIETEYWGGMGAQSAVAWSEGKVVVEPKTADGGPINEALRALGIDKGTEHDEFDAIGLGQYRSMDDLTPDA
jgi:hypothetical protein